MSDSETTSVTFLNGVISDRNVIAGVTVERDEIHILNDFMRNAPAARVLLCKRGRNTLFEMRLPESVIPVLVDLLTKPILPPSDVRRHTD